MQRSSHTELVCWAASTRRRANVDVERIVLIGASTGSHPALVLGAADPRVRAMVGISPVIVPDAFTFPIAMATEFAGMLSGTSGQGLVEQRNALPALGPALAAFAPRPVLLVAAERDDIFPPAQYTGMVAGLAHVEMERHADADHSFSECRPWLVQRVTGWLTDRLGA